MFKNKYLNIVFWLVASILISMFYRYIEMLNSKSVNFLKELVIFIVGIRVGVISFIPFYLVNTYLLKDKALLNSKISQNILRVLILIAIVLVVSYIHDTFF